ncbi:hypothetical protein L1049_019540 [Liquidambar formosana]|uniref:Uncharacterized protein n=1 Tax=Liquidambar formosana TaxID=63359 RepID=A0AAP0S5Z0_LIQFO
MLLEKESIRYISWVNQVLDSLGGSNLDDFRVCFDLGKDSECHIDRWIEFAIGKRVRTLELDLKPSGGFREGSMRYNFPLECYARIKQPRGLHSIKSLTSLCLKYVNISGELVRVLFVKLPPRAFMCGSFRTSIKSKSFRFIVAVEILRDIPMLLIEKF